MLWLLNVAVLSTSSVRLRIVSLDKRKRLKRCNLLYISNRFLWSLKTLWAMSFSFLSFGATGQQMSLIVTIGVWLLVNLGVWWLTFLGSKYHKSVLFLWNGLTCIRLISKMKTGLTQQTSPKYICETGPRQQTFKVECNLWISPNLIQYWSII